MMNTPYAHSPYGFDCLAAQQAFRPPPYHELPPPPPPYKAQAPPRPSWSMPSSTNSSPVVRATAANDGTAMTDYCFHSELAKYGCEYVALPQHIPTPAHWASVDVSRCPRLFVGQVRFEVTLEQLGALITYGCGVVPASVVHHRAGCLIVYLFTEEDRALVRGLHRRLLFDVNGAWLAKNEAQLWAMDDYLQQCSPVGMRRFHLPRGALVIECFHAEAKRLAAAAAAAAAQNSHSSSPLSSQSSSPKHAALHPNHGDRSFMPRHPSNYHQQQQPQQQYSQVPPPPPHYMARLKRHDSGLPSESSSDDYAAQH